MFTNTQLVTPSHAFNGQNQPLLINCHNNGFCILFLLAVNFFGSAIPIAVFSALSSYNPKSGVF